MIDFSKTDAKELASVIYQILKSHGIDAVLVGGACVSIYSENQYLSYDLDFVSYEDLKSIEKALKPLGFKRVGRCFSHDDCPYILDFVNPPVAVGQEHIRDFEMMETSDGVLQLLTPLDCVKDRLVSYFHWSDEQGLEQAFLVAKEHRIDLDNLKKWAKTEGFEKKLEQFLKKL